MLKTKKKLFFWLIILVVFCFLDFDQALASNLMPSNLVYKGAFKLPEGQDYETKTWDWGGNAAAYYKSGDKTGADDGYPGSLFASGNAQKMYIGEISVPKPVKSAKKKLSVLNTATNLQGFYDISNGLFESKEIPRLGLTYLKKQGEQYSGKLYYNFGWHMQERMKKSSIGWFDIDLADANMKGPWKVKNKRNYATSNYLLNIPRKYSKKLDGMKLGAGRFRDGGQGGQGPSLYALAPWQEGNPPKAYSKLKNKTLLHYKTAYVDPDSNFALDNYANSDQWGGGAWLTLKNKSAVIFVGFKGKGNCWYGYYDGTVWPDNPPFPEPGPGERGWWSDSFEAEILFYKSSDLIKVAKRKMAAYEPQPYAIKNIESKMFWKTSTEQRSIGGVTYDRKHNLLYVFEFRGDQKKQRPLVHVWKIRI